MKKFFGFTKLCSKFVGTAFLEVTIKFILINCYCMSERLCQKEKKNIFLPHTRLPLAFWWFHCRFFCDLTLFPILFPSLWILYLPFLDRSKPLKTKLFTNQAALTFEMSNRIFTKPGFIFTTTSRNRCDFAVALTFCKLKFILFSRGQYVSQLFYFLFTFDH